MIPLKVNKLANNKPIDIYIYWLADIIGYYCGYIVSAYVVKYAPI